MNKEIISEKQAIFLVAIFIIGASTITIMGLEAKRDLWLANIVSICMAFPILVIYSRLHSIFLGKNLFDIFEICLGKFGGKIISLLYVWFTLHLAALIINGVPKFINNISLIHTPAPIILISFLILVVWIVKEGIEVIARWCEFFLPILVGVIIISSLLLIPEMSIENLKPILSEGWGPIIKAAFASFSFPYAETVVLTMFFSDFKTKKSPYKIYLLGLLIGGIILLIISLTTLLVLNLAIIESFYYVSYEALARINIGDFLQRVEIVSAITYELGLFIKLSICFLVVCKGLTKIFGFTNYRFIVIPVALILGNLSYFLHNSLMELLEFDIEVWPYYAFIFQVILPIIILIIAEIKKKNIGN